jgi:hypothetical protein
MKRPGSRVNKPGRAARLRDQISRLRAARWPPAVAVAQYPDDDPAALDAYVSDLEDQVAAAGAFTIVVIVRKSVSRPADEPVPWVRQP